MVYEPRQLIHLFTVASMKLSYTMGGLFMCVCHTSFELAHSLTPTSSWEFFTSLNYELSVIRGRRPYRWTIWVCSQEPFPLLSG